MATVHPDGWWLNREIAKELLLPPQFLTKILRILAEEGILASQRGKTGGFRLARAAASITLLEIIVPFDHIAGKRACLLGQATCSDETSCPLHDDWKDISNSIARILGTRTLADIAGYASLGGFPRSDRAVLPSAPIKQKQPPRKKPAVRARSRG